MRKLCLIFLNVTLAVSLQAQQPGTSATVDITGALEVYQSGDVEPAIKRLTEITKPRPDDPEAWEALAKLLQRESMFGRARPALERLVMLRPNAGDVHARLAYVLIVANERERAISEAERALELGDQSPEAYYAIAEGHFRSGAFAESLTAADLALSIKPDFVPALITKSLAHTNLQQYQPAAANLEKVLAIAPNDIDADTWRGQIEELKLRVSEALSVPSLDNAPVFTTKEVTQKARVTAKPEPSYSEQARVAGVCGTIVLRVVFSAGGEVKRVFVTRALGFGLTTKAVNAARLIRFTPATKDERPVSTFMQLEYNFNLY